MGAIAIEVACGGMRPVVQVVRASPPGITRRPWKVPLPETWRAAGAVTSNEKTARSRSVLLTGIQVIAPLGSLSVTTPVDRRSQPSRLASGSVIGCGTPEYSTPTTATSSAASGVVGVITNLCPERVKAADVPSTVTSLTLNPLRSRESSERSWWATIVIAHSASIC